MERDPRSVFKEVLKQERTEAVFQCFSNLVNSVVTHHITVNHHLYIAFACALRSFKTYSERLMKVHTTDLSVDYQLDYSVRNKMIKQGFDCIYK